MKGRNTLLVRLVCFIQIANALRDTVSPEWGTLGVEQPDEKHILLECSNDEEGNKWWDGLDDHPDNINNS
jgi:hypothetical protein